MKQVWTPGPSSQGPPKCSPPAAPAPRPPHTWDGPSLSYRQVPPGPSVWPFSGLVPSTPSTRIYSQCPASPASS
ncbi:unnamed protein product [Nyctereutes procyonoides]|uniref:(raccoon dog) hypothetical protein n=1 Tax=Nyctereutes procyonoides TaxID=34880 RepID=A0A811ZPZ5_NYCPR|nr:unnamed protein product [Nyctereutes procyonoides]